MRDKQIETDDQVKLSPILGIRPGVYLTILYSLILLLIFFFLLVFPGLKNPTAVLIVETEPAGAAIRINDVYMGVSASKIPLAMGSYTISAVLPGFEAQSADHTIKGRLFGSLFFPLHYHAHFTLKSGDPAAVFAQAAGEFASWSFGGEPTATWQIPLSLSEAAYRIGPQNDPAAAEILIAASRFTVTRAALRDLIRAKMLLDNGGISPSPLAVLDSIGGILVFLSDNPGSAQWLSSLLPPESAAIVKNSVWLETEIQSAAQRNTAAGARSGARQNAAGLSFINFNNFWISENPVPRSVFETFLNENPQWKAGYSAREVIFPAEFYTENAITDITWHEAQAFCTWLTGRLPSSLTTGMEVRLPTQAELETASSGINSMANFWEWCINPYAPLDFIAAPAHAIQMALSPERSLYGQGKTSLPQGLSSPFVTFRPIIAEK